MIKRIATAGLIPAMIVSAVLTVAFVLPAGAVKTTASSCGYGYLTCDCTTVTLSPATPVAQAGSTILFTASATSGCPNPQFAFWLKYPGGLWVLRRTFSAVPTYSLNTAFFQPGHYVVRVWANQVPAARHYDAYDDSPLTLTGCTSVGVTGNSSSSARGAAVTFTAVSSGCTNPQFQFYVRDTSGKWHLMQAFSSANTWTTWNNTGWATGTYYIGVWANAGGSYLKVRQTFSYVAHTLT